MILAAALGAFLLLRVTWWLSGLAVRGAKPRSAQSFSQRPLLGRWSASSVKRLRTLATHGPDAVLPRTAASITRPTCPAVVGVAAINPAPDFDSFTAGLELMVFTALFTIGALLVLNWIVKMMRGSD